MLEDLVNGQEKSPRVIIKDSCSSPGRILLLNWIAHLLKRLERVILICSERASMFYSNWLPGDLRESLLCICGNTELSDQARGANALNLVAEKLSKTSGQSAVVVDSLTMFIINDGAPATCSLLHRLSADEAVSQVVAVLHQDVHDDQSCSLVEHACPSVISLRPDVRSKHVCSVRHCRPTGKVFRTEEYFTVNESFVIQATGPFVEEKKSVSAHLISDQNAPSLDLPFNLSLTEKEKVERSQVKLPYLKDDSEDASSSSSRIHYEPDEADDFDEEDPDDDLNI